MIDDPLKQIGMTTPIFGLSHCRDVVAAVTRAGGVGFYGAGLHSDEQIAIDLRWIEDQVGDLPFGIYLLMPSKYVGSEAGDLCRRAAPVPFGIEDAD